ncbi:hypothetical protein [Xanthomonas arboricola]|uniref:hypothetical protein n=1 Tax=Xanthomonas arboricola TaxID=56448 RepID=UPI001AF12831|nr:hypothetical protein [Xanthomonas arboricola]CAD7384057.1 hypothetical protein X12_003135 [Xanthomonas arboricola]CAG2094069.1 hypothetical protein XCY_003139 [Xanthomonas arboricola pv. juglandis]
MAARWSGHFFCLRGGGRAPILPDDGVHLADLRATDQCRLSIAAHAVADVRQIALASGLRAPHRPTRCHHRGAGFLT